MTTQTKPVVEDYPIAEEGVFNEVFKIPVLEKHIVGGECGEPYKCAVALALFDYFGHHIAVGGCYISFKRNEKTYRFLFSNGLLEWIHRFDSRRWDDVQPFTICLRDGYGYVE